MSKSRIQRLELMLLLQEKYQMNSVQISDFLNSNNIKTPRNKIYNHKIVWGSIKKYSKINPLLFRNSNIKKFR